MLILQQVFGSRSRLKEIARMFPRSMVEFFAAFTFADISMAKANPFLGGWDLSQTNYFVEVIY